MQAIARFEWDSVELKISELQPNLVSTKTLAIGYHMLSIYYYSYQNTVVRLWAGRFVRVTGL